MQPLTETDADLLKGQARVAVENVQPEIDGGRFPIKRVVGDIVEVEASVFSEGHDEVQCAILFWEDTAGSECCEAPMEPLGNDRWCGSFRVTGIGRYCYTVVGWVDTFGSWRHDLDKRIAAGNDTDIDYMIGAGLLEAAAARAREDGRSTGSQSEGGSDDAGSALEWAGELRDPALSLERKREIAASQELERMMDRHPDRSQAVLYDHSLSVEVDRELARFGAWYEFFPRSASFDASRHGTFRDCEAVLDYVAAMGFDVLYFPPIHPIGRHQRKGKNNSVVCGPDDVGSPWGIGADEGGHKSVHPELGTLEDFQRLSAKARERGLEIALDIAFQCSPDHPYLNEHREWFRERPDGSIQYAENPPKKYQDIYPFDFGTPAWKQLWEELRDVLLFWIGQGVRVFRVDNPHTKPFRFWEWAIGSIKRDYPETIFLSEAFTRPHVMYRLAKLGFSQSYTYFTWRNAKHEITEYFTELTQTRVREFFRPNLWPNTPDILPEYLQFGGRPAFLARLILAATLGASYGIYGPAFELLEHTPREPASEEYLNSEKYELKAWNLDDPASLRETITLVNRIRRQNPALRNYASLRFHPTDNDQLICYSKHFGDKPGEDSFNLLLVVVNLDPYHTQAGWVDWDPREAGIANPESYQIHDLLSGESYTWQGSHNYIELNPNRMPAHILSVRGWTHTEKQFDYYT
jgi:starch synthase (maltosyl-transferring)